MKQIEGDKVTLTFSKWGLGVLLGCAALLIVAASAVVGPKILGGSKATNSQPVVAHTDQRPAQTLASESTGNQPVTMSMAIPSAPVTQRPVAPQRSVLIQVPVSTRGEQITMDPRGKVPVLSVTRAVAPVPKEALEAEPQMPALTLDWLKHLERIENQRRSLALDQLAGVITDFVGMMGAEASSVLAEANVEDGSGSGRRGPTVADVASKITRLKGEWVALVADYRRVPPPEDCAGIDRSYSQALGQTHQMAREIMDQLEVALQDPRQAVATLLKMRGTSSGRVDVAAAEADDGVRAVCGTYRVKKWFTINSDFGSAFGKLASGWSP